MFVLFVFVFRFVLWCVWLDVLGHVCRCCPRLWLGLRLRRGMHLRKRRPEPVDSRRRSRP